MRHLVVVAGLLFEKLERGYLPPEHRQLVNRRVGHTLNPELADG